MNVKKENQVLAERSGSFLFNPIVEEMPDALSIRFNQMVYDMQREGRQLTVLSLGEAFFDIPLFDFNVLNITKSYHYSDSQGIPELRQKIAKYYERYGVQADPDTDILISAGSKPLIYMSMLAVLQPGEEVAVHEPCWLSYPEQARLCQARTRFIPFDTPVAEFGRYLSPRTRVMILNNPNNPAGRVYTRTELENLYGMCREQNTYLMVDEAYSDFVLDGSFVSAGTLHPRRDNLIIVNSLSKNMGISGWRIGYVIGHPDFIRLLLKINQHVITCAPTILQQYCAHYFDQLLECTLPQVKAVVEKRKRIAECVRSLGLTCLPGASTFYFFISIEGYPGTSMEFGLELLRNHAIAVVPGSAYGKSTDRFIRVGIGAEPDDKICAALETIKKVITQTRTSGTVFTSEQYLDESPPSA